MGGLETIAVRLGGRRPDAAMISRHADEVTRSIRQRSERVVNKRPRTSRSGPDRKVLDHERCDGRTLRRVSVRLDPSWKVVASPSTPAVDRCVDIFSRPDGTFGFEEFRRDPEDMGAWTAVAYYSERVFLSEADALAAACDTVPWLSALRGRGRGRSGRGY
jgi:hypothetical protein